MSDLVLPEIELPISPQFYIGVELARAIYFRGIESDDVKEFVLKPKIDPEKLIDNMKWLLEQLGGASYIEGRFEQCGMLLMEWFEIKKENKYE